MPKRILILVAVLAAAAVGFVWYRRRQAQTAAPGHVGPQTALATLQASDPRDIAKAAIVQGAGYVASKIPGQVGAGVTAVIPSLTPAGPCPAGYVGQHPNDPNTWCAGVASGESAFGRAAAAAARSISTPAAGYYG